MYVAGIDIGTTSIAVIVVSAETGETMKATVKANDAALPEARGWERLQSPVRIAAAVSELLAECRDVWPEVAAVGISCQMHGILYVDRQGNAISPLYTWQDGRGDRKLGETGLTYAQMLRSITGRQVSSGYGLAAHYYNVLNGEVPRNAAYLCTIGDYAAMKLCGTAVPVMDVSNAAGIGLFSVEALAFDSSAMERAGLDPAILPPLAGREAIAGRTTDGKLVACAIGDNQASFLGAVPRLAQTLLFNVGTGSQLSVYTDIWLESPGLETRPFPGGGFLLVGASLSGGKSYALLEAFFRGVCGAFGTTQSEAPLYEQMNRLAGEALAGSAPPLRFGTQFYGTRLDPAASGSVAGLRADNFTAGHFAAGILGGVADELLDFLAVVPDPLRQGLRTAAGSGNGIRKNPVLRQLLGERLGMPLRLSAAAEEAAFGAAVYAAVQAGLFPDIEAALAAMHKDDTTMKHSK